MPTVFYLPGCPACEKAEPTIEAAEGEGLVFRRVDVSTPEGHALLADTLLAYRVPPDRAGKLPMVTLGDRSLVGPEAVEAHLSEFADRWKRGEGRKTPVRSAEAANRSQGEPKPPATVGLAAATAG